VRDLLTEGIPVIDLLSILNSTGKVGEILCLDQSSVSRIYRQVDDALKLNIVKHEGKYKPTQNLQLLNTLRHSCQALRLCQKDSPIRVFVKPSSLSIGKLDCDAITLLDSSFGLNMGLKLLNEKAIDIFITDGFEVLPEDCSSSQQSVFAIQDLIGTKLYPTSIQPATHPDHPLQNCQQLNGREFWSYPSIAVSNDLFPRLSRELIAKGLWQDHYDLKKYTAKGWEGKSKDRKHIIYISDFAIKLMDASIPLKIINFDLGIRSYEVALVHKDNINSKYLNDYIFCLKNKYSKFQHI
jgi:hypothetical protein